eukprot:TRINITY_DN24331_c0_g3_i1.p1 TRINITY_DN24331_c0_g3~~TRINITY_DN24331_c0_g3_i1.p1  ORF type:complete len:414 (+),score=88.98 TRINITY_DN24331_c0_g3_i1:82-1323(+)
MGWLGSRVRGARQRSWNGTSILEARMPLLSLSLLAHGRGFAAAEEAGSPTLSDLAEALAARAVSEKNGSCPSGTSSFQTALHPQAWLCVRWDIPLGQPLGYLDHTLLQFGFLQDCERMLYVANALGTLRLPPAAAETELTPRPPAHAAPQDGVFVDIGASIGACAVRFASLGIPVLAVEPHPMNARRLRGAARLNGFSPSNFGVVEAAVQEGGNTRTVGFYGSLWDPLLGHTGRPSANVSDGTGDFLATVPALSLEELFNHDLLFGGGRGVGDRAPPRRRSIGVLKIDVEGAELEVLRSSGVNKGSRYSSILAEVADVVYVDVHPEALEARGHSFLELDLWLQRRGYWTIHWAQGNAGLVVAVHERVWPGEYGGLVDLMQRQVSQPLNALKDRMWRSIRTEPYRALELHGVAR